MKAIIHIGHHKTGTTSLQGYLTGNWAALLRAGLLYPWVESQGAAWGQAQLLRPSAPDPDLLPANVREPHNALAFAMLASALPDRKLPPHHRGIPAARQLIRALHNQIEELAPDAVMLVSEVMTHFGVDAPELIDQLAAPFIGAETALLVTLRRPDDHLISWLGQQLWFGNPRPRFSDPEGEDPFQGVHFDYRAVIEPWLARIPDAAPTIRPYRTVMQAGGSIDDFFAQSGLSRPDGLIDTPTMNQSLPRALFPLLRAVNQSVPRPAARTLGPDLLFILDELDLPAPADIEFFGPEKRAEMAERFRPIHDWLSELTSAQFFDDIDTLTEVRPISEDEALAQVLAALTDEHIAGLANPDVRACVSELKAR